MESRYAEEIVGVVSELRNIIFERLDKGEIVSFDDIPEMTRAAFESCAKQLSISSQTVSDKCARQMGLSLPEFYDLIRQFILKENKDLVDIMVRNRPSNENEVAIRIAMDKFS